MGRWGEGLGRIKRTLDMPGFTSWSEARLHEVCSNTAKTHQLWVVLNLQPHTVRNGHMCTCTNTRMHHKGKLRQLLGTQHEQPHRTCRQTDDYLHDKDLKYSHQNVFPWSAPTTFHVHLQSKWSGFDIKAVFQKGLKDAGFDITSARTERLLFLDLAEGGAERP